MAEADRVSPVCQSDQSAAATSEVTASGQEAFERLALAAIPTSPFAATDSIGSVLGPGLALDHAIKPWQLIFSQARNYMNYMYFSGHGD